MSDTQWQDVLKRAGGTRRSIMCAGLSSSGSTWVFNVVVQLLRGSPVGGRVVPIYADDLGVDQEAAAQDADWLVVKTHMPSPSMRLLSRLGHFPAVLSVRDPRDAVSSLVRRFGVTFDKALDMVQMSGRALIPLKELPNTLLLRYEEGFTAKQESVAAVAQHLGISSGLQEQASVFAALTPGAVTAAIAELHARNAFVGKEPASTFHPETHWHPGHVGDGRVGKWINTLTPAQAARVNYATRQFCTAFSYDSAARLAIGETANFSTEGTGANYLDSGFSHQETWGVWTEDDCALLRLMLQQCVGAALKLEVYCRLAPTLRRDARDAAARIAVNGVEALRIPAAADNPEYLLISLRLEATQVVGRNVIEVRFEFDGLLSPAELGRSSDPRRLGLGLVRLRAEY